MQITKEFVQTLINVDRLGPQSVLKICELLKTPSLADNTSDKELLDYLNVLKDKKDPRLSRVHIPTLDGLQYARQNAIKQIRRNNELGISVVTIYDDDYPDRLRSTVNEAGKIDAPLLLYYKGDLSITKKPALAVIGTREPTIDGITAGQYYASAFASIGVNIVSGLAIGCDTAGHRGALDAGGSTTAFLAHGLDSIYPPENTKLAEEIVEKGGLLMSEYPVGTIVNRYNLVNRDRLQAGLANATIVVQTGISGGTMHAVNATLLSCKPLFVVDYRKPQGSKTEGNEFLKREKGANGLGGISSEEIKSHPEKFLSLIGYTQKNIISEKKQEQPIQGSLQFEE